MAQGQKGEPGDIADVSMNPLHREVILSIVDIPLLNIRLPSKLIIGLGINSYKKTVFFTYYLESIQNFVKQLVHIRVHNKSLCFVELRVI